jgi:DNA-directed RNA polymerase specialized sigma24 family protein
MQDAAADTSIAANVLAGDPGGRAELYDRHAAELYEYCLTMLRDGGPALGALTTTLMVATARLAELPDRGRLRPWLFALARDECRRRTRSGRAAAGAGSARPGAPDAGPAGAGAAALFTAALALLDWNDREVIALCVRHHLIGEDLADVLGLPAGRVRPMLADARVRLQRAFGALFIARTGRAGCRGLARTLRGWDGHPSEPVVRRIRGHIRSCVTCQARELRELPSWEVLAVRPEPCEDRLLAGVRPYVLSALAVGGTPAEDLIADLVRHRTGTFGTGGFPAGQGDDRRRLSVQVAAAAAGVAAAGAVIVMFAAMPGSPPGPPALAGGTRPGGAAPAAAFPRQLDRAGPARPAPWPKAQANPAPSPGPLRFVWLGSVVQFAAR